MPTFADAEKQLVYNRVPSVTIDFWLIKLLAVTMGETAADYLAVNMGLGLTATSLIMTVVLLGALVLQFGQKKYVPWAYWLAVVLISIVGTLVTDNFGRQFRRLTHHHHSFLFTRFNCNFRFLVCIGKDPVDSFDFHHQA